MAAKTVAATGFDLSFFKFRFLSLSRAWHDDQAREICFKHSKIKGGTLLNTIRDTLTAFLHNLNEHSRKTRMKLGLSYTLDLRSDSISVECRMVNSRTAA